MPNHVRTQLNFICDKETLKKIRELVITKDENGEEYLFNFENIVPVPAKEKCPEKFLIDESFNKDNGYGLINTKAHIDVDKRYPYLNWYDWHIKNWGTKWNAYDVMWLNDSEVVFNTAWSFCEPVVITLSKLFPEVSIEFKFADENIGCNCDFGTCNNGVIQYSNIAGNSAMQFAIEMWGMEEFYEFVDGEYKYIECPF